jgi:hypothetical protein
MYPKVSATIHGDLSPLVHNLFTIDIALSP